jgi:hypothetical protein
VCVCVCVCSACACMHVCMYCGRDADSWRKGRARACGVVVKIVIMTVVKLTRACGWSLSTSKLVVKLVAKQVVKLVYCGSDADSWRKRLGGACDGARRASSKASSKASSNASILWQ